MRKFTILFLWVALVGCKKDDEVTSFTITSDTSLDFNPGQSKDVTYASKHIERHNTPTAPEGWDVVRSGNRYIITAPSTGAGDRSGTVKLSVVGINDANISRSISVAVRDAEEITVEANSIIVTEPDRRFKFKTDVVAASGERVWSTSKTAVKNVSYEDGWVYFATGADNEDGDFEPANAVIAALNEDGDALASWHIWVSDEMPGSVYVDGHNVMDRNLGASSTSDLGVYYQWGRKDPFAGPVQLYDHRGSAMTYDFEVSDAETGTVNYAKAHPTTFIAGWRSEDKAVVSDYDWVSGGARKDEWDLYSGDPCPSGWKVAPAELFDSFSLDGAVGGYDGGWAFAAGAGQIFFPAAGRRSFSPSLATWERNFTNVVNNADGVGEPVGFYWAANGVGFAFDSANVLLPKASTATRVAFQDDKARFYRAGGFSVRCVRE